MNGYVAGWDGGGTKTTVEILSLQGTVLFRGHAGPLNINGTSLEEVQRTITGALALMAAQPGGLAACHGLCIGSAGVSNPKAGETIRGLLGAGGYEGNTLLVGDHETALYGAHNGGEGLLLITGTGSICVGRDAQGNTHRCGGWGHLVDDEGSGYAIGRDVLAAVCRAADGRTPQTMLTPMVWEKLGISSMPELIAWIYRKDAEKKDMAALAPLFSDARDKGDEAALAIQTKAAAQLALLVQGVAGSLGMHRANVVFSGSIILKDPPLRASVEELLARSNPGLCVTDAQSDAARGAALMALAAAKQA